MKNRVLIADDDQEVREALARALEQENYEVVLARTAMEAFATMIRQPADLLLLDLKMPNLDGWDTLNLINVLDPFLPVIIITGLPCQQKHGRARGVEVVLEKPLDLPLLAQTIRRLLLEAEQKRIGRLLNQLNDCLSACAQPAAAAVRPHALAPNVMNN